MSGKVLEHTSDLYIEGTGKNIQDAIKQVCKIMFKNMGSAKKEDKKIKINSSGYDHQIMIVEFFSKILAECESNKIIPKKIELIKIDLKKNEISANLYGEYGNLENIIKAATYNSFVFENEKDRVLLRVLFDI